MNPPVQGAGLRRATVVAVDDESIVLELVVEVLNELGLAAFATGNPRSALAMLTENPCVDLLITDVRMPEMSGVTLARHARRLHPNVRILFITGYAADFSGGVRDRMEGTTLLTKPFALDVLASTIEELMR
jgi:two-component system cell cycle sensor histidine kinase/response regulator CckA